jgi:hypothetical protein
MSEFESTELNEPAPTPPVSSLPNILMRTTREITSVLNSLYRSRAFLEQAAVPRLRKTHLSLEEVSSATESATLDLLEGLDRTLFLIDEIGRRMVSPENHDDVVLHNELREEVHRLVASLQFQDLVAQQIGIATRVLQDTERRMIAMVRQYEIAFFGEADTEPDNGAEEIDGELPLSLGSPKERQALADAVFAAHAQEHERL